MRLGYLVVGASLCASPALAGLEICNATGQDQSIAIGHMVDGIWTSEGWWNIEDGDCATPIEDDLLNRYYYYRAEVKDGVFQDQGYVFCISDRVFTVSGQDGCKARGFESAGFALIDTGETATHFELTLVPPGTADAPSSSPLGPRDTSSKTKQTLRDGPTVAQAWDSGYVKGTDGEPFTQIAMFQGCDAFDGARYCAFFADGWKWFAYYGGPTSSDFLDRLEALRRGVGVEIEGDILTYGDISLEIALSKLTVRPASLERQQEVETIQGRWVSTDDASYTIEFAGGEVYERYPGTPDTLYFWRFAETCDLAPPEADFALIKTIPESQEQECWLPDTIAADRLEFVNPGRGNILSFRRP